MRSKLLLLGQRLIETNPFYLAPLSYLYGLAVHIRNFLYDHILPITTVRPTVVSIGNIVAGGTGKTPFTLLLAQQFPHRKLAILSRGYGPVPDEALLLSRRLPHIPIHIGKNRAALAQTLDVDLILLDDGFQHRRLHRDFDILLGPTTGHYLPRGFLRDSPRRIRRAQHFSTHLIPSRILDLHGNPIPTIRNWPIALFSAIAKPANFRKTAETLGAHILSETIFADHQIPILSQLPPAPAYLCTEKDMVKLPPTNLPIYYLEMELVPDSPDQFAQLVQSIDNHIAQKQRQATQ